MAYVQASRLGEIPDCPMPCYQQKSVDYGNCTKVPPAQQELRQKCFEKADADLEACCSGKKRGVAAVAILVAAGILFIKAMV